MLSHTSKYSALTEEQLMLLGRISVEWSNIEYMLTVVLSRLLLTPEYLSRTYTKNHSAFKLIEAIKEALEIHRIRYGHKVISSETYGQIKVAVNSVDNLRKTRNKVSHYCWCRSHDNEVFGMVFTGGIQTKKSEQKDTAILSNEELESIGHNCHEVAEKLASLAIALPSVSEEEAIQGAQNA